MRLALTLLALGSGLALGIPQAAHAAEDCAGVPATLNANAPPPGIKNCTPPAEGETQELIGRINDDQWTKYPYHLSQLPREEGKPRRFQATLNLSFSPQVSDKTDVEKSQIASKMHTHVQGCLDRYQEVLKGPEGDLLQIQLAAPTSKKKPSSIEIKVDPACAIRENARCYAETSDCRTILHEVLHLLGLADEYEETLIGSYMDAEGNVHHTQNLHEDAKTATARFPQYDCRAVGPALSIMRSTYDAERAALRTCRGATCRAVPRSGVPSDAQLDPSEVEAVFQSLSKDPPKCPDAQGRWLFGWNSDASDQMLIPPSGECPKPSFDGGKTFQFTTLNDAPRRESILYPAHFYRIMMPKCELVNAGYNECIKNAYRTSKKHQGKGCKEPVDPKCKTPDWLDLE